MPSTAQNRRILGRVWDAILLVVRKAKKRVLVVAEDCDRYGFQWGAVPEQRIHEFETGELDKSPEWGADFRTRTKSFKIMGCIPGVPRAMDRPFCVLKRVA